MYTWMYRGKNDVRPPQTAHKTDMYEDCWAKIMNSDGKFVLEQNPLSIKYFS